MKDTRKTLAALLLLGAGAGVFFTTLIFSTLYAPQEPEVAPPAEVAAWQGDIAAADMPARLRVPALSLDAHVQHVGLKANGQMANPTNFTDVGWYKYGPAPGYRGSAVMAGHIDNGLALAGVFKRLAEVKVGDELEVLTAGGELLRFRVSAVGNYHFKEVPAEMVFNRADTARLNLITCGGAWLAEEKTYDRRLIVYAELVR